MATLINRYKIDVIKYIHHTLVLVIRLCVPNRPKLSLPMTLKYLHIKHAEKERQFQVRQNIKNMLKE